MSPARAHTDRERAAALAGVFQAARLVTRVARHGDAPTGALEASLASVLQLDAESVEAVFGSAAGIAEGLTTMLQQLSPGTGARNLEVTRYVIGILHLERKLSRRQDLLQRIREGLETLLAGPGTPAPGAAETVERLAQIYLATVATLGPRIMVHGEPTLLARPENASRIRALLLAGVRAAVLWRQCGGSRLGLLLGRQRILRAARELL
ncbi:MAG: high frequency lysogenization protein HflD [Gammaproteobacteria bacterium]|nr:high frequency lysogenization protein HflD [Gammaproteobacteria bacterium]